MKRASGVKVVAVEAGGWVRERYLRTRRRLGKQRGPKVARVEVARSLATAIWHMLTKSEPFAPPAGPAIHLVA
jgi:transposase